MRISVKVQPKSSRDEVVKNPDGSLKVYLKAAATEGKANKSLINILADLYGVGKSDINIVTGLTAKSKIVEIGGRWK